MSWIISLRRKISLSCEFSETAIFQKCCVSYAKLFQLVSPVPVRVPLGLECVLRLFRSFENNENKRAFNDQAEIFNRKTLSVIEPQREVSFNVFKLP